MQENLEKSAKDLNTEQTLKIYHFRKKLKQNHLLKFKISQFL